MIIAGVDVSGFQRADDIQGEDETETALLQSMHKTALDYVNSQRWRQKVSSAYLGFGVGRVIAVFLFVFAEKVAGIDEALWIVVGDLPTAYFVTDNVKDANEALIVYYDLMEDWADAVLGGAALDKVFPVKAAPTQGNALALRRRTSMIREMFVGEDST